MKIFNRLNKMAFLAFAGLVIGGCGFFGDLFGGVASSIDSTQGKLGEGQSVCNNINKDDLRFQYRSLNTIGKLSGGLSAEQVAKILNVQISYIDIKRNEKNNICGFVTTTNNTYQKVTLTSQEIGQLERALADNSRYGSYEESKERQKVYYTALKFLKYIKRWNIPNNEKGIDNLFELGDSLLYLDKTTPVGIYRFVLGKQQDYNGYASTIHIKEDTNLDELRDFVSEYKTKKHYCEYETKECPGHLNEVRAIKNYAESVLNQQRR